jgi:hypothetical protein
VIAKRCQVQFIHGLAICVLFDAKLHEHGPYRAAHEAAADWQRAA